MLFINYMVICIIIYCIARKFSGLLYLGMYHQFQYQSKFCVVGRFFLIEKETPKQEWFYSNIFQKNHCLHTQVLFLPLTEEQVKCVNAESSLAKLIF